MVSIIIIPSLTGFFNIPGGLQDFLRQQCISSSGPWSHFPPWKYPSLHGEIPWQDPMRFTALEPGKFEAGAVNWDIVGGDTFRSKIKQVKGRG